MPPELWYNLVSKCFFYQRSDMPCPIAFYHQKTAEILRFSRLSSRCGGEGFTTFISSMISETHTHPPRITADERITADDCLHKEGGGEIFWENYNQCPKIYCDLSRNRIRSSINSLCKASKRFWSSFAYMRIFRIILHTSPLPRILKNFPNSCKTTPRRIFIEFIKYLT